MAGNAPDLDPLDEAAVTHCAPRASVDIEEADSLDASRLFAGRFSEIKPPP